MLQGIATLAWPLDKVQQQHTDDDDESSKTTRIIFQKWPKRPFQYSSAININIADIVITLLDDMVNKKRQVTTKMEEDDNDDDRTCDVKTRTILDPTCGSGTFLAFAMAYGMCVEGYDYNPQCIDGTIRNLESLFGHDHVQKMAHIQCQDSTSSTSSRSRHGH